MGTQGSAHFRVRYDRGWRETWEDAMETFLKELKEVESIADSEGTTGEKYKRLCKFKDKYTIGHIPVEIIESILAPEVEKMNGVRMEIRGESVFLVVEHLDVEFGIGYNNIVKTTDHSDFEFVSFSYKAPTSYERVLSEQIRAHEEGKVSRHSMIKTITEEYMKTERRKNRGFIREYLYTQWSFARHRQNLSEYAKRCVKYDEDVRKKATADAKNKVREEVRYKIVKDSGLDRLLRDFQNAGIPIQSGGFYEEPFLEEK